MGASQTLLLLAGRHIYLRRPRHRDCLYRRSVLGGEVEASSTPLINHFIGGLSSSHLNSARPRQEAALSVGNDFVNIGRCSPARLRMIAFAFPGPCCIPISSAMRSKPSPSIGDYITFRRAQLGVWRHFDYCRQVKSRSDGLVSKPVALGQAAPRRRGDGRNDRRRRYPWCRRQRSRSHDIRADFTQQIFASSAPGREIGRQ